MAEAQEIQVQPESVTTESVSTDTSNVEGTQQTLRPTDDEALDQIFGDDDAPDETTPESTTGDRPRDEHGRFVSKATEPDPQSDTPEPEADASSDTVEPEKEKALKAIRRTGASEKVIKGLSDEDIVMWGNNLLRAQAEQDRIGAEYARLKGQGKDTPSQASDTGQQAAEPELSLSDAIEPFVESYGEEAREPLMKLAKALQSEYQKQIAPVAEAMRAMAQEQVKAAAFEARNVLEKEYPQLKDETRRTEVAEAMEMFYRANPKKFDDVGTLMAAACKFCFAEEQMAEMKNKLAQTHEQRRNANPSTSTRKNGVQPTGKVDPEDMALEAIMRGDGIDAARKAFVRN